MQALADEIAHDDSPEGRAYRATEGSTRRHARLLGKREGVLLALDYLRDYEPPPSSDRTTGGEPDGD
ncbi:MAG TPA: hypothetical protein VNT51_06615 [Miltoncostaeaceae bacterium]|nr:hypothetical protein [Miltoncostaeaceae bacterium]